MASLRKRTLAVLTRPDKRIGPELRRQRKEARKRQRAARKAQRRAR